MRLALRSLMSLTMASFVALGLLESQGVAWPSISDDLGRTVAELGLLVSVGTTGYLSSSFLNGRITRAFGTGRALVLATTAAATALATYAATPSFVLLLAAAFVLGCAGGLLDAGLNAWVAVTGDSRSMNLLHAFFGVGATLGPLLMTAFITIGDSWRGAYLLLAAIQAVLAVTFWRLRDRWGDIAGRHDQRAGSRPRPRSRPTLITGLGVFFLYVGVEVGAGEWAFSLLTESRGVSEAVAGILVAAYWGTFTLGRFAVAAVAHHVAPERLIRLLMAGAIAGIALLWWNPATWIGSGALLLLGFSLSGIFPSLMVLTPGRLGPEYAPWAVGYQLAAASLGVIAIPGAAGLLVAATGLESLPPLFLAAAVAMLALNEVLTRISDPEAAAQPTNPAP